MSLGAAPSDQVLDLHLAFGLLVGALDHRARRAALVGVFHLLADAVLGIAEIELGADTGVAQRRDERLVVGDAVAVEHGDHARARLGGFAAELADARSAPPCRRDTPMEKPVAGTGWPMKRDTSPS